MKDKKEARMVELKKLVKDQFGVQVYQVFQGKCGNSNSGNTARRVFSNPEKLAKLVGANVDLIEDLWVLVTAVNCKEDVDPAKFQNLCEDWKRRFFKSSIKWNWPNPSIHAMIEHGEGILLELPCAPGYWTEEGCETSHKIERSRREYHARKMNIDINIQDVVVLQLCSSDPIIIGFLQDAVLSKRPKEELPKKVRDLLVDKEEDNFEEMDTTDVLSGDEDSDDDLVIPELNETHDQDSDLESDHEFDLNNRPYLAISDHESEAGSDEESEVFFLADMR